MAHQDRPNPHYRQYLHNHYKMLAETHLRLGDPAGTTDAAEKLAGPAGECFCAAEYLAHCASLAADQPGPQPDYAARAVQMLQQGLTRPAPVKSRSSCSSGD